MTKTPFENLRAKAISWCQDFENYKEECRVFAERLRIEFIGYLGASRYTQPSTIHSSP